MGKNSGIQWTDHTFNPWIGCQRVSPGCEHCYAEALDKRTGGAMVDGVKKLRWGPTAPRVRTSAANWKEPLKWNREAAAEGVRRRVFCASMADVFEDRPELVPWRVDLFNLIGQTQSLDWLLLTKRPENLTRWVPWTKFADARIRPWPNVWLGTTVEDQQRANERIPALLAVPAAVRFLSMEPLLERVDLDPLTCPNCGEHDAHTEPIPDRPGFCTQPWCTECDTELGSPAWLSDAENGIDWVIIGGESGGGARPFELAWARSLVQQCRAAGVAPFMKQLGSNPIESGERPRWQTMTWAQLHLRDHHGGDPAEWPADLRVREFPTPRRDDLTSAAR